MSYSAKSGRIVSLATVLIPLAVVVLTVITYYLLAHEMSLDSFDNLLNPAAAKEEQLLQEDRNYYVFVKGVEVYPEKPSGKAWDIDNSPPDLRSKLVWQGREIFKSPVVGDSLIGNWQAIAVDAKRLAFKGEIDLGDAISAGLINIASDPALRVEVEDSDTIGGDTIGGVELDLTKMRPGDNTFSFSPEEAESIRRLTIRFVDGSQELGRILEQLVDQKTPVE